MNRNKINTYHKFNIVIIIIIYKNKIYYYFKG